MSGAYRHFDTMCWPVPGERISQLAWTLAHSEPTKEDLLVAASVLSAYAHLIKLPQKRRNEIVRELRKGPSDGTARGEQEGEA